MAVDIGGGLFGLAVACAFTFGAYFTRPDVAWRKRRK